MGDIERYCKKYFDNYSKNYRKAWLLLRKKRYQEIVDNGFYLGTDAETFKNEVMKFWAGKDGVKGWSDRNSWIKKKNSDEWILFHNKQADIPEYQKIIERLNNNDLDLHGNYSWSKLHMGGDITANWERLKEVLYYLLEDDINDDERFIRFNEIVKDNGEYKIRGMSNGKASIFLHIKYPNKYGVWNGCTDDAFKIFRVVDSEFDIGKKIREASIRGDNIGAKYKMINEQLKWLLENYNRQEYKNGFENLSDVDIFVWYISNNFAI